MSSTEFAAAVGGRKATGSWYTPPELVDMVIGRTITPEWVERVMACRADGRVSVVDPACGDGRFLEAARARLASLGVDAALTGVDIDPAAVRQIRATVAADVEVVLGDALSIGWTHRRFDLVVGNPPFLSQLASGTSRGGASRHGGGPYADAAVEFLALSTELASPHLGRVALLLPQSLLASRDAAPVRAAVDRQSRHVWAWWSPRRHFDADVLVCAICIERSLTGPDTPDHVSGTSGRAAGSWAHVVAEALDIPELPRLMTNDGTVGDRAHLNANFRDEYYGLVPAVLDAAERVDLPRFVTSGVIDPGHCSWGERPVRFAKRTFAAPRVDIDALDDRMRSWAERKLTPKVLVAAQTSIIEAVADLDGSWLPGVPVVTAVPRPPTSVEEVAAVLTSPVASAVAWWSAAGTGLSAKALRLGPSVLSDLPWPAGDLAPAVAALARGDVGECGIAVARAHGLSADDPVVSWWIEQLP